MSNSIHDWTQVVIVLEQTSKRSEMITLLHSYLASLDLEYLPVALYLMQGSLGPVYTNRVFNISEKILERVSVRLLGVAQEEFAVLLKNAADAAAVIRQAGSASVGHALSFRNDLLDLFNALQELTHISGPGAAQAREDFLYALLCSLSSAESRAVVMRIIAGKLRAGFSDMTILAALARESVDPKKRLALLEFAYMRCADIGKVALIARKEHDAGLAAISIVPGIPVVPAAAERLNTAHDIFEKLGPCVAQPKLDGFRIQMHSDGQGAIRLFSRHLHDVTESFPDLVKAARAWGRKNVVIEGEAIGYNAEVNEFLPFQQTVKRKRKHDISAAAQEVPLIFFAFDILFDGEDVLSLPHYERRARLVDALSTVAQADSCLLIIQERKIDSFAVLQDYFYECIQDGLEGLVVKRPDAPYQAGKRGSFWIKLKRHSSTELLDTVDGVIIGYYFGRGKRSALGIGALLIAVYNSDHDRFETVAKVGTGFSDAQLKYIKQLCDQYVLDGPSFQVYVNDQLRPDVSIQPMVVCEVSAEEITESPVHTAGSSSEIRGLGLRFPRFLRMRDDKGPFDITTVRELRALR